MPYPISCPVSSPHFSSSAAASGASTVSPDGAIEIGHAIMRSVEKIVREDANYVYCITTNG
eukprot:COSAG02_NODE_43595_length_373_cov_0.857664_1_plen_60_part_01